MSDETSGLYGKYFVQRLPGESDPMRKRAKAFGMVPARRSQIGEWMEVDGDVIAPPEKHARCRYYVLDLEHDAFAGAALRAYAEACAPTFPALAADLRTLAPASPPPAATASRAMCAHGAWEDDTGYPMPCPLCEVAALRAEVETQRKCRLANEQEMVRADAEIGRLRAEVSRLTAVLARIADAPGCVALGTVAGWAREALGR